MPGAQMCPRQGATVSMLLCVRLVHVPCTCTWLSISVSCERVSLRLCPCVVLLVPGAYLVNSANNKQAPTREVPGPDPEGPALGKCLSLGSTAVQTGEGRGQQA